MRLLLAMFIMLGIACGGDDPEPLLSASISGSADGMSFTPEYGVSTVLDSGTVATVIGTGEIGCDAIESTSLPPSGIYVNIQIPEAIKGVAAEQFFSYSIIEGGDLRGGGSGSGTVEVTSVSETNIAMTVSHSATVSGTMYDVSGSFEALRCP